MPNVHVPVNSQHIHAFCLSGVSGQCCTVFFFMSEKSSWKTFALVNAETQEKLEISSVAFWRVTSLAPSCGTSPLHHRAGLPPYTIVWDFPLTPSCGTSPLHHHVGLPLTPSCGTSPLHHLMGLPPYTILWDFPLTPSCGLFILSYSDPDFIFYDITQAKMFAYK